MKELSTERFVDPYAKYMTWFPEVEYNDVPIKELSAKALSRFANSDGSFIKSFDATLGACKEIEEMFIVSSTAYYESENGEIPAVQIRIIDDAGQTLYYAPVYEIGHAREFYRREWRVMPVFNRYATVRFSFIIPEGVRLYIRDIKIRQNYGWRERDIGIRYHGHGGCTNAFGMQLTAEAGFTSCITIPKFTKDGIGVCMHDDESIQRELSFDDGSKVETGSPLDKPISEFTYAELMQFSASWRNRSDIFAGIRIPTMEEYFRICSMTGMQPIFSVHPALTKEQWIYVRRLLEKYRLLEHFWVKSGIVETQRICNEVFGTDIAGRILIQGAAKDWDPAELAREMELDPKKNNVVIEFFGFAATEKKLVTAKNEGFLTSIAAMKGGVSGPQMQKLIDLGVTEFTLDHHMSMGLSW
ncbi:MAG: hypothetical protein E7667_07525 [Ruminococcaceae bacterium]|nr:hypothetical protein [Oscillospiraceae bacterium]